MKDECGQRVASPEAYAAVLRSVALTVSGDREGALLALDRVDDVEHLRHAAVSVLAGVMSGETSRARFDELRAAVLGLAQQVGTADALVTGYLEVVAAAEALAADDQDRADAILNGSEFPVFDAAHAAATFTGQAILGWLGAQRAQQFLTVLRREYGVEP